MNDSIVEDIAKRRRPINKLAAIVTGSGESWVPRFKNKNVFKTRPPLRKPKKGDPDYTGISFGRLTVIGLNAYKGYANASVKNRNKAPAKWVCRCLCGNFVNRKAKEIKEAKLDDMCYPCRYLEKIKKESLVNAQSLPPHNRRQALHNDQHNGDE